MVMASILLKSYLMDRKDASPCYDMICLLCIVSLMNLSVVMIMMLFVIYTSIVSSVNSIIHLSNTYVVMLLLSKLLTLEPR